VLWDAVGEVWLWSLLPGEPALQERCRDELRERELLVQDVGAEAPLEQAAGPLESQVQAMLQLQEPGQPQQVHLLVKLANESWQSVWAGD